MQNYLLSLSGQICKFINGQVYISMLIHTTSCSGLCPSCIFYVGISDTMRLLTQGVCCTGRVGSLFSECRSALVVVGAKGATVEGAKGATVEGPEGANVDGASKK